MKLTTIISAIILAVMLVAIPFTSRADDKKPEKVKPYPLDTCLVCGMKLSGMGKPYVFDYKDQEIKVCDKSEKKEFDKDPAKYMKKLKATEAKEKKK